MNKYPDGKERLDDNGWLVQDVANEIDRIIAANYNDTFSCDFTAEKATPDYIPNRVRNVELEVPSAMHLESKEDFEEFENYIGSVATMHLLSLEQNVKLSIVFDNFDELMADLEAQGLEPTPDDIQNLYDKTPSATRGKFFQASRAELSGDGRPVATLVFQHFAIELDGEPRGAEGWVVERHDNLIREAHTIYKIDDTFESATLSQIPAEDPLVKKAYDLLRPEDASKMIFATNAIISSENDSFDELVSELSDKYRGTAVDDELPALIREAQIRHKNARENQKIKEMFGYPSSQLSLQQLIELRDRLRDV